MIIPKSKIESIRSEQDAAGELAAIAKAKEVLESGVKVFLQVAGSASAGGCQLVLNLLAKIPELIFERILTELRSEKFEWFGPSPIEPFNPGSRHPGEVAPLLRDPLGGPGVRLEPGDLRVF